ncbi:MAG: esterase/lipase family protein, partial [Rhodothermales bacterium]
MNQRLQLPPLALALRGPSFSLAILIATLLLSTAPDVRAQQPTLEVETEGLSEEAFEQLFERLSPNNVRTGLLLDKAANFADVARFDGTPRAEATTLDDWRQAHQDLIRSQIGGAAAYSSNTRGNQPSAPLPDREAVDRAAAVYLRADVIPLAILSVRYNKIRPEMEAQVQRDLLGSAPTLDQKTAGAGRPPEQTLRDARTSPYSEQVAFAVAPYQSHSAARTVHFTIAPELYLAHGTEQATRFEVDCGDGRGFRSVALGEVVAVSYAAGGQKTIQLTAREAGTTRSARALFEVLATSVPAPDRSWTNQTARRGFEGKRARYDAYVFYGRSHTELTRPVIFVEGFDTYANDPAKRRTWQDMYRLAAEENVAATLQAHGYDLVLFKLHDAADYIQRNAYALETFLDQVNREMGSQQPVVVVGPSMGGLIGRFTLASMERKQKRHNVRLYVSVDAPHQGANIPLGDQFLFEFFDNDSDQARAGKIAINSPAARQMLIYQYQAFPNEDPLRTRLKRDLQRLGYPRQATRASLASGSGYGRPQRGNARVGYRPMRPGDKIVEYRYRSFFVDL